jgi:hypothetical protein
MLGRYIVELILILLCGMGLHAMEVVRTGGAEAFVSFNQVCPLHTSERKRWQLTLVSLLMRASSFGQP